MIKAVARKTVNYSECNFLQKTQCGRNIYHVGETTPILDCIFCKLFRDDPFNYTQKNVTATQPHYLLF